VLTEEARCTRDRALLDCEVAFLLPAGLPLQHRKRGGLAIADSDHFDTCQTRGNPRRNPDGRAVQEER